MVFAPKLSEGVAFNQPVQQPNAMEAIAGLFNFGVDVASKNQKEAPKPTQGDKFDMAIGTFVSEKGGTFSWDKKSAREFIFKYPQFAPEMKSYLDGTGVFDTPTAVAEEATMKWFETSPGQLAVASAEGLPESQREAYLSEQATKFAQQEADLIEIERNSKMLAAQGTLNSGRWDAMKPVSKDMVDHTVGVVLNTIVTDVTNGLTVEVDPQLKAMLGLRYDKVDMNNLNAVLVDSKVFLEQQFRDTYRTSFGEDVLPSDDWNKQVFASLDGLMKIGESVKDPVARAATQKALIESEMYKRLDENGVAVFAMLAERIPGETLPRMIGTIAQFDKPIMNAISGGGSVFGTAGITSAIQDGSKSDAESIANDTIKTFEYGIVPEFFTAFKEALGRTGHNVVDGESFKRITGDNIPEIIKLTSTNPDFRAEFGDFLTSDIQQTISIIKSNLSADNFELVFDGKQFSIAYKGDFAARLAEYNKDRKYPKPAPTAAEIESRANLPEDMNLRVLNEKIATLGLMGGFGKEIQGAVGILNTEPKADKKPVRGGQPPRGRGRGRNVGAELGIDFAGYEAEAGLPSGFLNTMAIIESSGNPSAQNDSTSAGGLFQQIDSNAAQYGVSNRFDPVQSTEGAVAFAQDNTVYLAPRIGREPTGAELYLAHQQGPGGAASLLANPDKLAVDIVGADAVKLNGGSLDMTAQEFANIWINKYNKIATGGVGPAGAPVDSLPKEAQVATPTLSLDSGAEGISTATSGSPTASTGLSTGTMLSFESPEVQQIVEKATSAPEEAIAMAKEILAKPMDPSIKALIEALVRIGERA